VQDHCSYDYAVIRVVPRVDREEFINAGVIVSCAARSYLEARVELDEARLLALDSSVDLEAVRAHLASIPIICAGGAGSGPIGKLSQRERFHWLTAPRSTIIQTSRAHTGRCTEHLNVIEHLLNVMVRPQPTPPSSRSRERSR